MENKYDPSCRLPDTTRREFVQHSLAAAGSVWASSALPLHAETAVPGQKPNLIFIYGEGHRWDCLSVAGHAILETPNHDRIGREGVRFTNAFCTNALCAPARSSVLTGMYSKSTGALDNKDIDRPLDVPYFTDMLQEAGYDIALVGKAHCRNGAKDRKWDYYFGFNAPVTNYYRPVFAEGRKGVVGPRRHTRAMRMTLPWTKHLPGWLSLARSRFVFFSGRKHRTPPITANDVTLTCTTA